MAAESVHLITVSIYIPAEHKSMFKHKSNAAFTSDSFSDTAIPIGLKWTREWWREEIKDLVTRCGQQLRAVRWLLFLFPTAQLDAFSAH
jgi:transcription elongation factor SPT6